ncbi:50S ribosomal protein L11 methyltransferase [Pontibacter sp. BT310]|uniref:Ribosomal protein L11 methyltransferase n=1 Tax=Pontibacter populi TaxID=890055 RepID=A0ABS6XFD6_9BACT|nr:MULTISPECIES: 50S ribosomal protein L11 methyltransferase [Pontibacter]MBJ6119835.1 50S ribosomal protein L11 methyltransferase [Pontibacter sp. BT310]MBR0572264.1 50S ribosomal protein L11 methyltransferase [Microvirga sp. STS03]MBW3366688.1 50S ribosomal protein L11 methyltransferase [Pontibacter populi]
MDFIEVTLKVNADFADIFTAELGELGFNAFEENEEGFSAYIDEAEFSQEAVEEVVNRYAAMVQVEYTIQKIARQNWNEEWEKNFEPLFIGDKVSVRASFHEKPAKAEYDIVINPKMSFGTGHHETTTLMIENQLTLDHQGKRVLDMGCGTGILAIMAGELGASEIVAVEIEDWTVENARENAELNGYATIDVRLGGAETIKGDQPYDIILANINRNVLLEDMPAYVAVLKKEGYLLLSGFYTEDLSMLQERATELGLTYLSHRVKNNWVSAIFKNS